MFLTANGCIKVKSLMSSELYLWFEIRVFLGIYMLKVSGLMFPTTVKPLSVTFVSVWVILLGIVR